MRRRHRLDWMTTPSRPPPGGRGEQVAAAAPGAGQPLIRGVTGLHPPTPSGGLGSFHVLLNRPLWCSRRSSRRSWRILSKSARGAHDGIPDIAPRAKVPRSEMAHPREQPDRASSARRRSAASFRRTKIESGYPAAINRPNETILSTPEIL
jgi:hypothetical protein